MTHDGEPLEALTISGLRVFIASHAIEETYEYLDHDYAAAAQGKEPPARFVRRLNWKAAPNTTEILRFFNQLNTWYAETWALSNVSTSPTAVLTECNRMLLYREEKRVGLRNREISFGSREFLDFMDPRRQFKRLVGTTPSLIAEALRAWSEVAAAQRNDAALILLSAALLAIHPFSDANGRLARVMYSWMRKRVGLTELWLAEDDQGECLTTGAGVDSTEYLLGALQLRLARHHNAFPYGGGRALAREDGVNAHEAIVTELRALESDHGILNSPEFVELYRHLHSHGHFQHHSPRFASLRDALTP
ncbi:MAG: Fic family protein [Acidobacteriota bacterium]